MKLSGCTGQPGRLTIGRPPAERKPAPPGSRPAPWPRWGCRRWRECRRRWRRSRRPARPRRAARADRSSAGGDGLAGRDRFPARPRPVAGVLLVGDGAFHHQDEGPRRPPRGGQLERMQEGGAGSTASTGLCRNTRGRPGMLPATRSSMAGRLAPVMAMLSPSQPRPAVIHRTSSSAIASRRTGSSLSFSRCAAAVLPAAASRPASLPITDSRTTIPGCSATTVPMMAASGDRRMGAHDRQQSVGLLGGHDRRQAALAGNVQRVQPEQLAGGPDGGPQREIADSIKATPTREAAASSCSTPARPPRVGSRMQRMRRADIEHRPAVRLVQRCAGRDTSSVSNSQALAQVDRMAMP